MDENENYKIILRTIFIPLVLTFNIYSIKSLIDVSYKDVSNVCSNSNIWYYLLTITLLSISGLQKNNNNLESLLVILSILGFFLWGSYELFGVSCINQLKNTNVYNISLAYWIFITIILSIIIIITLCSIVFIDNSMELPRTTHDTVGGPRTTNLDVSIHGSLINNINHNIKSDNDTKDRINNYITNDQNIGKIKDLNISFSELSRTHTDLVQSENKV
jgi:hypothetical protein